MSYWNNSNAKLEAYFLPNYLACPLLLKCHFNHKVARELSLIPPAFHSLFSLCWNLFKCIDCKYSNRLEKIFLRKLRSNCLAIIEKGFFFQYILSKIQIFLVNKFLKFLFFFLKVEAANLKCRKKAFNTKFLSQSYARKRNVIDLIHSCQNHLFYSQYILFASYNWWLLTLEKWKYPDFIDLS